MGFWDDDEVRQAAQNAEYASFLKVGDEVSGEILSLGKRRFNEGKADERMAIEIKLADAPTVTAGQVLLMRALFDLAPAKGDHLTIRLVEVERRGAKTLKKFAVTVKAADGTVRSIDQSEDGQHTISDDKPPF
jgi:hypothetical protein